MAGSKILVVFIVAAALVSVVAIVARVWLAHASKRAEVAKATDGQYQRLAAEYRRIAELAVTSQEHTDLKLADITMRIDEVHGQLESVQQVLKEVE